MTTVYAEACCAPPLDDDDLDRLMDAFPATSAIVTRVEGGPVGVRFDVADILVMGGDSIADPSLALLWGTDAIVAALNAIGVTPTAVRCEIETDEAA